LFLKTLNLLKYTVRFLLVSLSLLSTQRVYSAQSCVELLKSNYSAYALTFELLEESVIVEPRESKLQVESVLNRPIIVQATSRTSDGETLRSQVGPYLIHPLSAFSDDEQDFISSLDRNSRAENVLAAAFDHLLPETKSRLLENAKALESSLGEDVDDSVSQSLKEKARLLRDDDHVSDYLRKELQQGVELGMWEVTFKSGRKIRSEVKTQLKPGEIDMMPSFNSLVIENDFEFEDVLRFSIFHNHPGSSVWQAAISPADVKGVRVFLDKISRSGGVGVEVHIYAISNHKGQIFVGHYSERN